MKPLFARRPDPLPYQALIALVFAGLVFAHLGIPSKLYFDEVHYVPAARAMLRGVSANPEHPLLAKEAIALAIRVMGDQPLAWRLPSAVMGVVGLFAFGRALWWSSGRAVAALAGMVALGSDFAWFIQSRIAMLDMVMAGWAMVALWMVARGRALPPEASAGARRGRMALAGVAMGLALGAKWSVLPVIAVVSGGMLGARLARPRAAGLGLAELALWLVAVPGAVYWLTYWPAFFYARDAVAPMDFVGWHRMMLGLQTSVVKHHPYQSVWWQWVINERAIWYLYERVDGAQRGVMLIGNPFTMLAGLVALGWCAWDGWARGRALPLVLVALYGGCLGLWIVGGKPVQFYYHYLLPGTVLMAALGLAVDALWHTGRRWRREAWGIMALSLGVFAWFYPIIAALPLHKGVASFEDWMWLDSWR